MVLATKLKNTKFYVKIIAVILSLLFAFASAVQLVDVLFAYNFYGDASIITESMSEKEATYQSAEFIRYVGADVGDFSNRVQTKNTPKFKKELEKYREAFCKEYLKTFERNKKSIYNDFLEFPEDYEGTDIDSQEITISMNFRTDVFNQSYYLNCDMYSSANINLRYDSSDEEVAKKANALFDELLASEYIPFNEGEYVDYLDGSGSYGVYCYAVYNKTGAVETNFKSDDIAALKKSPDKFFDGKKVAFTYINGKYSCCDLFKDFDHKIIEDCFAEGVDYYCYINPDDDTLISEICKLGEKYNAQDLELTLIVGSICAVVAIAFAAFAVVVAGNRKENGKAKLLFVDYIPVELHFAITLGLGFLGGIGMEVIYNAINRLNNFLSYAEAAFVAIIWAVLIEFFTSVSRIIKSDRKKYKFSILGLIGAGIYKLTKKITRVFKYEACSFNKLLIRVLVSYGGVNLVFFAAMMLSLVTDFWALTLIVSILIFGLNIAAVVFITKYVVMLDRLIQAAKCRVLPDVDYNKLPNSLKILYDSIKIGNSELQNAVAKAVRDERMRTELITNVSHDLKTPLTSIINYVDLLKGCEIDDENASEYIDILDEKGGKLKRLIEDLIEASKISSGVVTINSVSLNLGELAAQAVVEHQQEFTDNNLDLVFKGDKTEVTAFADGNKTFRVIENLLSNAKKYSAKGSRVYVDILDENNTAIFEIKNISAQPLDITPQELIQRFVRGDKSRNAEGNGLGLSIADNLCRAMNGRLELIIDGDLFKARVILPKTK